eukprot:EG_transcript_24040
MLTSCGDITAAARRCCAEGGANHRPRRVCQAAILLGVSCPKGRQGKTLGAGSPGTWRANIPTSPSSEWGRRKRAWGKCRIGLSWVGWRTICIVRRQPTPHRGSGVLAGFRDAKGKSLCPTPGTNQ